MEDAERDDSQRSNDDSKPTTPISEAVHLLVLFNFAVAQPLYSRLSGRTMYLLSTQVEPATLMWLALFLSFALPAVVVALGTFVRRLCSNWGNGLHGFLVFFFAALTAMQALDVRSSPRTAMIAAAAGGLFWLAYRRLQFVRSCVTVSAVGLVLFPSTFLMSMPLAQLQPPEPTAAQNVRVPTLTAARPVPVVMLVFDAFCGTSILNDRREIDEGRYPNFARLAREATWYRNASSVHPRTFSAVPAILTGCYPRGDREPTLAEHPVNLFTLLQSTGSYQPVVFETATRLFPRDWDVDGVRRRSLAEQMWGLAVDLAVVYAHDVTPGLSWLSNRLPAIPSRWFYSLRDHTGVPPGKRMGLFDYGWNSARARQFEHFLDCIEPSDESRLYFQHLSIPHFEWCYLPSGRAYIYDRGNFQPKGIDGTYEHWHDDEIAVSQAYQQYLLQVGYADYVIGRLTARLKEAGVYDSCLLIVTADHGVSFRPDQMFREPDERNLPDLMSVPLLVKLPHQHSGGINDDNVETIDLLPTICDVVGLNFPLQIDGESLLTTDRRPRPFKSFVTSRGVLQVDGAFESKYETLDIMLSRFGHGSWDDVFRIGPHPELIGRSEDSLPVKRRTGEKRVRIGFMQTRNYPELVPCLLEGGLGLEYTPPLPVEVAVGVNGKIRAVTRTFLWGNAKRQWHALFPEEAIQVGENVATAYRIEQSDGGLTLVLEDEITFNYRPRPTQ